MNSNFQGKKLIIGSANFGQKYGFEKNYKLNNNEIYKVLEYCEQKSINTIDTAVGYGKSQKVLGNFGVSNFNIITKLPSIPKNLNCINDWIDKLFLETLKDLKVENIYGILLHNSNNLLSQDGDEIYLKLQSLKKQGLVKKIGISTYNPNSLDKIITQFPLDIAQIPFNIFDRRILEDNLISKLNQKGVEIHARSIFLQGNLLKKPNELQKYFLQWIHLWEKFNDWQTKYKIKPLFACIKFVSVNKNISKLIFGIDTLNQLKEIVAIFESNKHMPDLNIFSNDSNLINPTKWLNQ